jgi:hypothetical protein
MTLLRMVLIEGGGGKQVLRDIFILFPLGTIFYVERIQTTPFRHSLSIKIRARTKLRDERLGGFVFTPWQDQSGRLRMEEMPTGFDALRKGQHWHLFFNTLDGCIVNVCVSFLINR